jgi:tripartite-type tricarboxylate transporter receptor subunit TctC
LNPVEQKEANLAKPSLSMGVACAVLALAAGPALAQEANWPSRTITIIVPFPAGGQQDIEARGLQQSMEEHMKKSVIVENRPGAGAALGIGYVARSQPDGHTVLITGAGAALLHLVQKNLGFDNTKDITPVSEISTGISLIVTNKQTGAKDWKEFTELARKNPGKLNYASLGVSSVTLAMEGLKGANNNLPVSEIPYKGQTDYMSAALRNEVQLILGTIGPFKPYLDNGAFVPLLVIGDKRYKVYPNVPSTGELGYGDKIRPFAWTGMFVRTGTAQSIIDRLYGEVAYYVKQPDAIKRDEANYSELIGSSPAEFKKVYDADIAAWGAVAKSINLQPQ